MEKLEIKYSYIGYKITMAKLLKALADLMISCWLILKIAIVVIESMRPFQ
jgi:hypothetical protein